MLKNWLIAIGYFWTIFLILALLQTILNYFNILSQNTLSIFKLLIPIISITISSYKLGKNSKEKGYLEGIKIGLTIISSFIIFVILLDKISIKSLLYYTILLLTSIISSMLGINRKKV